MFGRIIVPLDASSCSQDLLAISQAVAARLGDGLLLLHVLGAPTSLPDAEAGERWLALQAASLRAEGFAVDTVLRDGRLADALAAVAQEQRGDLIVLGRPAGDQQPRTPGLARLESTAQIIPHATVPLLAILPCANVAAALHFLRDPLHTRRALAVALDGSERAERVLPMAVAMARGLGQHLHLVRVVPPMPLSGVAGGSTHIRRMAIQTLFADVQTAHEYLSAVRRTIVATTLVHVQKRALIGDIVDKLLESAYPTEVGLLALITHGRGTFARARSWGV